MPLQLRHLILETAFPKCAAVLKPGKRQTCPAVEQHDHEPTLTAVMERVIDLTMIFQRVVI